MKVFTGKVVSTKMAKTATVEVERTYSHLVYKKLVKRVRKYQVHDEMGAKEGDIVRFIPSRPISKTKRWKIVEIVKDKKNDTAKK